PDPQPAHPDSPPPPPHRGPPPPRRPAVAVLHLDVFDVVPDGLAPPADEHDVVGSGDTSPPPRVPAHADHGPGPLVDGVEADAAGSEGDEAGDTGDDAGDGDDHDRIDGCRSDPLPGARR